MKTYTYSVLFVGAGEEIVTATSPHNAVILACAERIKKGKHTYVFDCFNVDMKKSYPVCKRNSISVNWDEE